MEDCEWESAQEKRPNKCAQAVCAFSLPSTWNSAQVRPWYRSLNRLARPNNSYVRGKCYNTVHIYRSVFDRAAIRVSESCGSCGMDEAACKHTTHIRNVQSQKDDHKCVYMYKQIYYTIADSVAERWNGRKRVWRIYMHRKFECVWTLGDERHVIIFDLNSTVPSERWHEHWQKTTQSCKLNALACTQAKKVRKFARSTANIICNRFV